MLATTLILGALPPTPDLAPFLSLGRLALSAFGSGQMAFALALGIPLIVAILVALTGSTPNVRDGVSTAGSALTFLAVCAVYAAWSNGEIVGWTPFELLPGVGLSFTIEPLGLIFALVASSLWVPTSIYAFGYMRGNHEQNQTRFFVCFALAIFASLAIAFAGNLVTLFVFYEVLTFSTFPLVAHHQTEEARASSRVYLGVLVGTSICLFLFAIIWTQELTGSLEFQAGGLLHDAGVGPGITLALLLLFAFGIGKAALMPFHRWLPAAMVAPTPVSALLHAVAVVKAGVFAVLKVVAYILGTDHLARSLGDFYLWRVPASEILVAAACFTILSASIVALRQDNLKRRLAYSTISQLSYMVLGAALLHQSGLLAGGMYIMTHAFGKITLFFCAGAIYVATHKKNISEMSGLGRKMPWTYGAFLLGSLSIIGLPPFVGAWSKWTLFVAALETERWWVVVVLVASSLLAIAYLVPVVIDGFFGTAPIGERETEDHHGRVEAPILCRIPLVATGFLCLLLFFTIDEWARLATAIATEGVIRG